MHGLAAITAHNGWAMAITGACIVMTGLAALVFFISQLHKLISLLEKKEKIAEHTIIPLAEPKVNRPLVESSDILSDLEAAVRILRPLTSQLGETFSLLNLYQLLEADQYPHPHITVREMRNAGYLIPTGDGSFSWRNI